MTGAVRSEAVVTGLPGDKGAVDEPPQLVLPLRTVVQVLAPDEGEVAVTVKKYKWFVGRCLLN